MVRKWKITIPELTGAQERNAYLYLPDSYEWEREKRYPVLYMFDGHNVFFDQDATYGKSWGMKEYLDYTQTQLLVAAVECNHSPDHGRLKEYSPFSFQDPKLGSITGWGNLTMDWLIHTFKKEIDTQYRTLPGRDHTFIAGSSMGGLMSLYGLIRYNSTFSRAAALSPSLWTAADRIREMITRARIEKDTVLYMDYGEKEIGSRPGMMKDFGMTAARLMEKGILLTCRMVPGGTHCEASWERQIPFFMNTLLYEKGS